MGKFQYFKDRNGGFIASKDGQTQVCDFREGMGDIYGERFAAALNSGSVLSHGEWTKKRPAKSGYYWYRDGQETPELIAWDADAEWIMRTGSDIPLGDDFSGKITGEFWSDPVLAPACD